LIRLHPFKLFIGVILVTYHRCRFNLFGHFV